MRNPLAPHLTSVPCNPQQELAGMVTSLTEAQRQEALDLWVRLGSLAKSDPSWFLHHARNMAEQAIRDGVA